METNLNKSLADMETAANELLSKSENSNPVQASVTASVKDADKDAASANGDLSDGKEKADKGTLGKEDTSSFKKSEEPEDKKSGELEKSSEDGKEKEDTTVKAGEISKSLNASDSSKDALEVSKFLSDLTDTLSKSMETLEKSVKDSDVSNKDALNTFAKSFMAIAESQKAIMESGTELNELVKSMKDNLDSINSRLEGIEAQPTIRKSVRDINVHDKDFNQSLGGGEVEMSKSQKLDIMNDLLKKGDTVVPMDIIGYETGSPLRPEVEQRIKEVSNK